MVKHNRTGLCVMVATTVLVSGAMGCSVGASATPGSGTVTAARVELYNRITQTASATKRSVVRPVSVPFPDPSPVAPGPSTLLPPPGVIQSINGTYGAGCSLNPSGTWSFGVTAGAILDYAPLSVATGDSNCTLTLTDIEGEADYFAAPAMTMNGSYQASSSSFTLNSDGSGPALFYANAMLSDPTFATDFVIDVEYSNDPTIVDANASSTYATDVSTSSTGSVAAPDCVLDLTGLAIQTDLNNVVQAVGGGATVTPVNTPAQTYVVDSTSVIADPPDPSQLAAIYAAQTPSVLSGNTIPVSAFQLDGEGGGANATLPTERNLILVNTDSSGVNAFEVIRVTFNAP